jgi:hypothetical protein
MPQMTDRALTAEEVAERVLKRRHEFIAGFVRSARGNLVRDWRGKLLTVFRRRDGWYGWSIRDEHDATSYSRVGYPTELLAQHGIGEVLAVGHW